MWIFTLVISCLTTSNLLWFIRPNIPGSYAILFFTASDFTFTTRHICNPAFPLWPSCFILSGAISNYPLLFISSLFNTFWPEGLIFQCHVFLPFHNTYGVLAARILEEIPISSFSGPCFARILQMTCPFWVALHGMANSLIELCETHCHDSAVIHEGTGSS